MFSDYGYAPTAGSKITTSKSIVTGSNSRVYYSRPRADSPSNHLWDRFTFTTKNNVSESYEGTITLVPPTGALVGSDFLLDNQGWTVVGNKASTSEAKFEAFSRGLLLNRYIFGVEDKINVKGAGSDASDASLWYFQAPKSFLGNWGIAYGGFFKFSLGLFSGDIKNTNADDTCVVQLDCDACDGPVGKGISLCFSMKAIVAGGYGQSSANGDAILYQLPLLENSGWTKDPQNSLKAWAAPSQCDIIMALSRLSRVRILGDWTKWYESVAIDDVQILNTKSSLPRCSNTMPDASNCKCSCKETIC